MPDRFTIETYCNRYEKLFSLVNSLAVGNISETDKKKLSEEIKKTGGYLKKLSSDTTDCSKITYSLFKSNG